MTTTPPTGPRDEVFGYCEDWHRLDAEPVGPLDEREAERRHASDEPITVVRSEAGRPVAVLQVRPAVGVHMVRFLDAWRSNFLVYMFERDGDRLFLRQATHYDYPDGGPHLFTAATVITMYVLSPDGVVHRRIDDKRLPTVDLSDRDGVDVTGNWDAVPRFGAWAPLFRIDR